MNSNCYATTRGEPLASGECPFDQRSAIQRAATYVFYVFGLNKKPPLSLDHPQIRDSFWNSRTFNASGRSMLCPYR